MCVVIEHNFLFPIVSPALKRLCQEQTVTTSFAHMHILAVLCSALKQSLPYTAKLYFLVAP